MKVVSKLQKERLTKDVRYQEFNELTLDQESLWRKHWSRVSSLSGRPDSQFVHSCVLIVTSLTRSVSFCYTISGFFFARCPDSQFVHSCVLIVTSLTRSVSFCYTISGFFFARCPDSQCAHSAFISCRVTDLPSLRSQFANWLWQSVSPFRPHRSSVISYVGKLFCKNILKFINLIFT